MTSEAGTENGPGGTKKRSFDWIALLSAVAAFLAAGYTYWNAHVASEQNIAAEQQQVLTITTSIVTLFANEQSTTLQAAGTLTGTARTDAESNASVGISNQLAAYGEAAQVLITKLGGNGIAGVEYVQVGKALAAGGDTADAIEYFEQAVSAPPQSPDTQASALRNEAMIRYELDQGATAHEDIMRAISAYAGHRLLTQADIRNSIAQSYLLDAEYQIPLGECHTAAVDLSEAEQELKPLGTDGESYTDTGLLSLDIPKYQSKCVA